MRKESSTNAINEKQINDSCGMAYSLSVLGGRWKPAILCRLVHQTMRYSDLKNSIEQISERMLVSQLRELEADQVVKRTVYPVVPPRVEYELTELGLSMKPMLKAMSDWGNMHRSKVNPDAEVVISEF
ncbi:winged helix-turn-helix transcriptional regulator [Pedobacter sp.]|jgi:DNA-binding HxlR family transcriptional regulator|uniref:winged helix-turn-helix transcriptional regulator n=1 Tax=Pedobacter sp. TaxID=1411316 RepID=UPI0018EDC270|nr:MULTISPECIES: helix-turn-helix domain-containing protein [unclassified Pedobacter]HWW40946.1 helix-turn-helix domain-containing protein [Pedobacter sp.]